MFCFLFPDLNRPVSVIDFTSQEIMLNSYSDQDLDPNDWLVSMVDTSLALCLFGNSWKSITVDSIQLDANDVWRLNLKSEQVSEIQGIGFKDSVNVFFYSLYGGELRGIPRSNRLRCAGPRR